jgi:hypothetical protein
MAPKEPKISKQAAARLTRHITFTIPVTLEIIRKPGSDTCQSVIMVEYKIGLLTIYDIKKNKKKITCRDLVQYRYSLINGKLKNSAPLQFCGYQIT